MKVGVAIAVIRTCPKGMRAGEYARQLCDRYQKWQLDCRQSNRLLKQELLALKQQLHLMNSSSQQTRAGMREHGGNVIAQATGVSVCAQDSELGQAADVTESTLNGKTIFI